MGAEVLGALAQFGAAGLIAWMWLSERRHAEERERTIREAHAALMGERAALSALLRVVEENARAMSAVEARQGELAGAIERLNRTLQRGESRRGAA